MWTIWLKACKLPHHEICRLADISENTLRSYLREFVEGGVEGLKQLSFHRPHSKLDEHIETVEAHFRREPPGSAAEAQATIARLTGIDRSPTQVRQFLHRMKMKFRKVGAVPAKADPEVQETFKKKSSNHGWSKPRLVHEGSTSWTGPSYGAGLGHRVALSADLFPEPQPHRTAVEVHQEGSAVLEVLRHLRRVAARDHLASGQRPRDPPRGARLPAYSEVPDIRTNLGGLTHGTPCSAGHDTSCPYGLCGSWPVGPLAQHPPRLPNHAPVDDFAQTVHRLNPPPFVSPAPVLRVSCDAQRTDPGATSHDRLAPCALIAPQFVGARRGVPGIARRAVRSRSAGALPRGTDPRVTGRGATYCPNQTSHCDRAWYSTDERRFGVHSSFSDGLELPAVACSASGAVR